MNHGEFLRRESHNPELASHIMYDHTQAELDPQMRGMLDFAVKLTREPWSMQEADVQSLRDLGLSDEKVLSVVLITCCFNFADRLADGLGVRVPQEQQQAMKGWLSGPAAQQEWLFHDYDQRPASPG